MLDTSAPVVAKTLAALREAEAHCTRCSLYKFATQVVPGEGRQAAPMMFVGEQPGDKEDETGRPFVGPAGRILNGALKQAEIDRDDVFVTNAVKHFKHEMRGKRRLHKRPNAYEIKRCRWWLEQERAIVKPKIIVALGATAARSVLQRSVTISQARSRPHVLDDGTVAFVPFILPFCCASRTKATKSVNCENLLPICDARRATYRDYEM
jgi:uracil-DNA glycosylase